LTQEGSISFWDTGEFASGARNLEVVHSPGAPLFLIIGRLFMMAFSPESAYIGINALSALCSGFTILFLFWSITHFGRRIALRNSENGELNSNSTIGIMAAGIVGALAYTFSDTFWFSAVEAEVYAMSSLLTAVVFWAILKWEDKMDEEGSHADRWIVFIAFILGLSIGVHLLNLLTIPAIVMVYYFKKFKTTTMGIFWAFLIGSAITGIVQVGVIQLVPKICAKIDIMFVNDFGLPFNSGVFFVLLLIAVGAFFGLKWAQKNAKYYLHIGILSFLFILIGYSSYFQTVIRSNADVPIDMTNPDNTHSLVSYLSRDQYGSIPHISGPDYNSKIIGVKDGEMQYRKGEKEYEAVGEKLSDYEFAPGTTRMFPRIWDHNKAQYYPILLGLEEGATPTGSDNLSFFWNYQINQMWWRYFCWNYIGRQNDFQQVFDERHRSNWLSGIKPIDRAFGRGDMDKAPEIFKHNKARNELYFLPFILGLIGLFFHIKNDDKNAFIVGLLFFFTGLAIVIYLNNNPVQPRERDYAFAGATYAFAIWIGLGVMQVAEWLRKFLKAPMSHYAAGAICLLAVPILMASKGWDDHDRSNKTLPKATGSNYLSNLDKNAIIFTEGDNDTYPLWYAQEVERLRPDVRIINLSLLGIDWYIDQLQRAVNESPPIPMLWRPEDYRGTKLNQVQYLPSERVDQSRFYDISQVLGQTHKNQGTMGGGRLVANQLMIPVNKANIKASGILAGRDSILNAAPANIGFKLPSRNNQPFQKNDLAVLNIIAANDWKRPIYFANSIDPNHYEGLEEYLEMEGLVFKLVPYQTPGSSPYQMPLAINQKKNIDWFTNKVKYGGAESGEVYYNQTNRRMLNGLRRHVHYAAENLIRQGKKEEAIQILDKVLAGIHPKSYPWAVSNEDLATFKMGLSYMNAGAEKKATKVFSALLKHMEDDMEYYNTLKPNGKILKDPELDLYRQVLQNLEALSRMNNMPKIQEMVKKTMQIYSMSPQQAPPMPGQAPPQNAAPPKNAAPAQGPQAGPAPQGAAQPKQ